MNKLILGDCLLKLKQIPDKSIDLIIVDPPYCINYKEWDKEDFSKFTENWIKECVRVLKDNGTMWSFMGYQNIIEFITMLKKYGMVHLENWVIWARQKGRCSSKHLKSQREDIIHFTKSNKFTWNPIKMIREVIAPYIKDGKPRGWFLDENGKRVRWTGLGNVWVYTAPFWKSKQDKMVHPSQKPYLLGERLILLSSNTSDLILDPFMGSGTFILAAKNNNRNYIGIEKNKKYYDSAVKRLK